MSQRTRRPLCRSYFVNYTALRQVVGLPLNRVPSLIQLCNKVLCVCIFVLIRVVFANRLDPLLQFPRNQGVDFILQGESSQTESARERNFKYYKYLVSLSPRGGSLTSCINNQIICELLLKLRKWQLYRQIYATCFKKKV